MMEHFLDGVIWENKVGYSRAIKVNDTIEVSGTTAVINNEVVGKGDPYLQTQVSIEKIIKAVENLGGKVTDIVRTRIFVKVIGKKLGMLTLCFSPQPNQLLLC